MIEAGRRVIITHTKYLGNIVFKLALNCLTTFRFYGDGRDGNRHVFSFHLYIWFIEIVTDADADAALE